MYFKKFNDAINVAGTRFHQTRRGYLMKRPLKFNKKSDKIPQF